MTNDSLQKTLAHLQSAARAAGKTISTAPLTDEQKAAELARLQAHSKPMAAQVMQQSQVGCPASPSTAPAQPPTPADGRVWLVDTWPHRQAIKASGQAGYDSQARRWYLLDAARYDRIPPQCLPKGYKPPAQDHQDHPAPPPSQPTGLPPLAQALADAALASGHAVARFKCSDLGGKGWDVEDILAARDVLSGIPGLGVLVDLFGRTHRVHIRIKPITSRWPYDEGSAGDVPAPSKPHHADAPQSPRSDDLDLGATHTAPPNARPGNPLLSMPKGTRYHLHNVDPDRDTEAIKATHAAAMDPGPMRWFVMPWAYDKPDILEKLRPWLGSDVLAYLDALPGQQAGAGGRAVQTAPHADPAPTRPAAVSIPETVPTVPVVESPASTTRATVIPFWPPGARGLPNPVIRSALFGVVRRGRREHLEQVRLPSIGGTEILYTGARLDQADLDVWMGILELFKGQDIAQRLGRVTVPAREFLRIIARAEGGKNMAWLERTLARLSATNVQIKGDGYTYGGSLVVRYARDERTGQLLIEVDPKLVALFQATSWSRIDWQERQALGQDHLAKWLHAFYSSHASSYPIRVQTLREWSGASASELYEFRRELREAMTRVSQATGWAWEIDRNDCLHVRKPKALP
jgi:hypothetical protein